MAPSPMMATSYPVIVITVAASVSALGVINR
jgi:hypothetical protein